MHPIFRLVLAIVAGIFIACMVIGLVDAVNSTIWPSSILHPSVAEQSESIAHSPLSEFLLVLFGYMLSSFFGGYTAGRIAPEPRKIISAVFIGFFLLLCGIVYFITIPQPLWFAISSGISYFLFAYLGGRVATRLK